MCHTVSRTVEIEHDDDTRLNRRQPRSRGCDVGKLSLSRVLSSDWPISISVACAVCQGLRAKKKKQNGVGNSLRWR